MSTPTVQTISRPGRLTPPRTDASPAPPLDAGDYLSRAEFHRRYEAHPEIKKAELVEGVVHLPSPVRFQQHSQPHLKIATWLGMYLAATPGVQGGDNGTVLLEFENEVQPDAFLCLETKSGGKSRVTAEDYVEGPPELVVEIAASSAAYDLHIKQRVYQRSGVQEYVALQMYEQRVDWFVLREGVYESLAPDENGVLKSEVFPGLWLQSNAFWSGDPSAGQGLAALLVKLQEGLASPEHAAYVARLQATASTG